MVHFKKTLLSFVLATASLSATAQNVQDTQLFKDMQAKFPNTQINSAMYVEEFPGMVELVVKGNKIIYTNESGSLFMLGHIFDTKRQLDITQERINSFMTVKYDKLPFENAIKVVKGNGSREFAVFTDPACPYCKKLEQELSKITDYTMFVFVTPFKSQGVEIAGRINCEKNPSKAWTDFMLKGIQPTSTDMCKVAETKANVELAGAIGVTGTPSLLSKNGQVRPGYAPAAQLDAWLTQVNK